MSSLVLFRNEDVNVEEPYRITVPSHIDTLAELCSYISEALPPPNDPSGKGYRFLYSLGGKPVWRVKDCLDAGTIIISTGPGFLARKSVATSDDVAGARDVTPANFSAQGSVVPELEHSGGVSQSPPAQQPEHVRTGNNVSHWQPQTKAVELGMSGSQPGRMSIQMSTSPHAGVMDSDPAASYRVSIGGHGVPWMSAAEAPIHSGKRRSGDGQSDGEESAPAAAAFTLRANLFGRGKSDDDPTPAASDPVEAKRLFTPESNSEGGRPSFGPSPTELRGHYSRPKDSARTTLDPPVADRGGKEAPAPAIYERPIYGGAAHAPRNLGGGGAVRGEVRIDGQMRPLPPAPQFAAVSTLLQEEGFSEDENLLTGLRMYSARKWKGFSELNATPPTDVLGEDVVRLQVEEQLASLSWPLRVVVSGPPRSGISTTAALALRSAISSSTGGGPLVNHLLLVLDCELLFGGEALAAGHQQSASATPLLDISFAFQLVVRAVLDAVSVQRPALRPKGLLIAQLWDKLVTVNASIPPDFTTFSSVTSAVGHRVVAQWNTFARTVFPILQAARRQGPSGSATRDGGALRDAALDIIFYALPGEIASSLRFSGILYAFDGLHVLAASHKRRVDRPVGDLAPMLQTVWRDENCHAVVAWPSAVPLQSVYLTPPSTSTQTLHIRTVGLITTPSLSSAAANQYRGPPLPQLIECQGRQYGDDIFLGCPGFLAPVAALAKPLVGRSAPTTAFSTYSQRRKREKAAEPFTLRVDDAEVGKLLHQLEQLVSMAK